MNLMHKSTCDCGKDLNGVQGKRKSSADLKRFAGFLGGKSAKFANEVKCPECGREYLAFMGYVGNSTYKISAVLLTKGVEEDTEEVESVEEAPVVEVEEDTEDKPELEFPNPDRKTVESLKLPKLRKLAKEHGISHPGNTTTTDELKDIILDALNLI